VGVRYLFAPGIYWDRRRPGGLPLQATMVLLADAVSATVCRRAAQRAAAVPVDTSAADNARALDDTRGAFDGQRRLVYSESRL